LCGFDAANLYLGNELGFGIFVVTQLSAVFALFY